MGGAAVGGRTVLVTGANTGMGLAPGGAAAVAGIKAATGNDAVFLLTLDLADLSSVRECAKSFLEPYEPLHVLINNAGEGGRRGLTKQGFELMFGLNHLGTFLL